MTESIRGIIHRTTLKLACMKASLYDDLMSELEHIVDTADREDRRVAAAAAPPAFSPESLRAMEELAAGEAQPIAHDPLDTAPAAQPAVTTTPDPLDAPRPRRGGRRSRGSEGSPQVEAAPETTPQPEPQPDDLDLPGEPLSDATAEAGPAPEADPSADPVDALFGTPGDDFDPLA